MKRIAIVLGLGLCLGATTAHAWEGPTTHAGLTEGAAAGSHLHARLRTLGWDRGLYEELTIPPKDASALVEALHRYPPTGGFVPDARGRQFALAWLVAGAVIADGPFAVDHFFDPSTGRGWDAPDVGIWARLGDAVFGWLSPAAAAELPAHGMAAPDWIISKDNPLGVAGFLDQYAKAVRGGTPGERSRAMAGALVAAGAILHVLEDLGSPSHVRGDARAHFDPVGDAPGDLGSRFERIAALAYGRIGVPGPARVVTRPTLRAFFTSKTASSPGLAEATSDRWFSAYTLPEPTRIGTGGRTVSPKLVRPLPAPPARMNLMAASQASGTTLVDAGGACLARYRVDRGILTFWLDDDCALAEVDAILPEVSSYAAGALDFLFRGELAVSIDGGHAVARTKGGGLGAGTFELYAEDARGVRTQIKTAPVTVSTDGAALGDAALPDGTRRVVALFTGVDASGEPIVAVGAADLK